MSCKHIDGKYKCVQCRLNALEGIVYGNASFQQPQTAPVPTLGELCEALLRDKLFTGGYCVTSEKMRQALTAEKRRQELVNNTLAAARKYVEQYRDTSFAKYVIEAVDNLDAHDKERGV